MRSTLFPWVIGLGVLSSGCSPIYNGVRTLIVEPAHYCYTSEECVEKARNRLLAEEAWEHLEERHPEEKHQASEDFEDGFKEGFADYLFAGGPGVPPPLPPRRYWKAGYETPQGYRAIADWFAGFRFGVQVAQESGMRNFVPVPTSFGPVAGLPGHEGPPAREATTPQAPEQAPATTPPAEPLLPLPRKVPEQEREDRRHPDPMPPEGVSQSETTIFPKGVSRSETTTLQHDNSFPAPSAPPGPPAERRMGPASMPAYQPKPEPAAPLSPGPLPGPAPASHPQPPEPPEVGLTADELTGEYARFGREVGPTSASCPPSGSERHSEQAAPAAVFQGVPYGHGETKLPGRD